MIDEVKSKIKQFADQLAPDALEIEVLNDNGVYRINLTTADERTFIGKENDKFEAFSHLVKKILSKTVGEDAKIVIDINNMRGKNDDALKAKATILAERARAFKRDIEIEDLSSYERRVIHAFLEAAPLVKTESIGEGKNRRLVIKYVENKEVI